MIGLNLTGDWALIEVEGQIGWATKPGVLIGNCVTYQILEDDGLPITSAELDFVLDPIPASFADAPCRENVPESEGSAAFNDNLRNCARVVLYYFSTEFRTGVNDETEIRMSDILSAVYAGELSALSAASGVVANGQNAYSELPATEIGREALINNFWVVAYTLRGACLADPNCEFRLSPEEIADSYLIQVQSWYQKAIPFRTDIEGTLLDDYYRASRLQRGLAFQALSPEYRDRSIEGRVWQWGNYGFGDSAGVYPTAQDNPSVMYCYTVRQFTGNPTDGVAYARGQEFWNDYKFVIITIRSIGQTSTFDIRDGANRPGWIDAVITISIDDRPPEPIPYPLYVQRQGTALYVPCSISANEPYTN
jgi:hypothetical protein